MNLANIPSITGFDCVPVRAVPLYDQEPARLLRGLRRRYQYPHVRSPLGVYRGRALLTSRAILSVGIATGLSGPD